MIFTTPHDDIHISYCTESMIGEDACQLHNSIKLAHCSSEQAQIWDIESQTVSDTFSNKPHDMEVTSITANSIRFGCESK